MSRAGTIDGPRFAVGREAVAGALEIGDLPRLAALGLTAASVGFTLRGDAQERATLTIRLRGELALTCQRCLGAVAFPVVVESVLELVEDELILAAPMIPLQPDCAVAVVPPRREEASPFAALAGLKESAADPRRKRNQ